MLKWVTNVLLIDWVFLDQLVYICKRDESCKNGTNATQLEGADCSIHHRETPQGCALSLCD